jgi:hypothetical protein
LKAKAEWKSNSGKKPDNFSKQKTKIPALRKSAISPRLPEYFVDLRSIFLFLPLLFFSL